VKGVLRVCIGVGQSPERLAAALGYTAIEYCLNLSCGKFGIRFPGSLAFPFKKSLQEMRDVQISNLSSRATYNRFQKIKDHPAGIVIVEVHVIDDA